MKGCLKVSVICAPLLIIQNLLDCVKVKADFYILGFETVGKTRTIFTSVKKTKRKAY